MKKIGRIYLTIAASIVLGGMFADAAVAATTLTNCSYRTATPPGGNTCVGGRYLVYMCTWSTGQTTSQNACLSRTSPVPAAMPATASSCPCSTRPPAGGTGGGGGGGVSPTSNNVSKSGGAIKPVSNSKASVKYQSQTTNSSVVMGFNYSNLPKCPQDPNSQTGTKQVTTTTSPSGTTISVTSGYLQMQDGFTSYVEDINQQMPYTTTTTGSNPISQQTSPTRVTTPPDQCYVRNFIECTSSTNGATIRDGINGGVCTTKDPISYANAAVCPDGYVQVGAFDMQPEIKFGSPPPAEYPITSMAKYQQYKDAGYTCALNMGQVHQYSICSFIESGKVPSQLFVKAYAPKGVTMMVGVPITVDTSYESGKVVNPDNSYNTGVGAFYRMSGDGIDLIGKEEGLQVHLYSSPSCTNSILTNNVLRCDKDWPIILGTENVAGPAYYPTYTYVSCTNDGVPFSMKFFYEYNLMRCTPPANVLYYSDYQAPRGLICARIKTQYDKINVKPATTTNPNQYTQ